MMIDSKIHMISLQLFADGAGAGSGAGVSGPAAGADGADSGDLSGVQYGIDLNPAVNETPAEDPAPEAEAAETFDSLIKGKFKQDFDNVVQDIVQRRVRNYRGAAESYDRAAPLIQAMAQRYGIEDASDVDAILAAFDEDSQLLEAEADKRNMPVEQLKTLKKLERENAVLKNKEAKGARDRAAQETYNRWMAEAQEAQKLFPDLNLEAEIQNPEFAKLLRNGVSVKTAYQVLHNDDIMAAGMQYATKQAERKVANAVAANAKRPVEGGNGGAPAAIHKTDPTQLNKKDMKEIYNRVMRGERISFG